MCPLNLRVVQRFLSVLLLPLIVDERLLHLVEAVRHLIVLELLLLRCCFLLHTALTVLAEHHEEA